MRLSQVSVLAVLLVPMLGFAQTIQMTCTNSGAPRFAEHLTIEGSGTDAKVHIADPGLLGDLTYNAKLTQIAPSISGLPPGSVAYSGLITSTSDADQGQVVFFIQTSVLNGQAGKIERMGSDDLLGFDCQLN